MDTRRSGLGYPLAFAALVLATGLAGRFAVDAARPQTTDGTLGKLLWVLAPLVFGVVFRLLDPTLRGAGFFRPTGDRIRFALVAAAITALATCACVGVGFALGATRFSATGITAAAFAPTAIGVVLFAFFEESAWRGYLLPSLLGRTGYLVTIAVTSVVWWAWHLPYLDQLSKVYTTEPVTTIAPRLLLGVVAMQVLYTEVFLRCRSVWPAFAIHATFNLVANGGFLLGLKLQGALGWALAPAADSVLLIVTTGAVGLWLQRLRGTAATSAESASVSSADAS